MKAIAFNELLISIESGSSQIKSRDEAKVDALWRADKIGQAVLGTLTRAANVLKEASGRNVSKLKEN